MAVLSKRTSMVSDSRRDAEKYHKFLLAIESATFTINALEQEGRASIDEVLASLLPNLAEALGAAQAFAAIQHQPNRNRTKGFELVSVYPNMKLAKPFLPWSKPLSQVMSDDRAYVIEPFEDAPGKLIPGLEIFNATTAVLIPMQIGYQAWIIGVCNRADPEMGPFLAADRRAMESIIKLIAIGLRMGERRSQLKTAKEIADTISLGLDLESTIDAVLKTLLDIFDRTNTCVLLFQSDIDALKFAPATLKYYKIQNPEYRRQDTFPLGERSIACRVARRALTSRSVICENVGDVMSDPDYLPLNSKIQSELCVSLMSTRNELLGVLALERYELNDFDDTDVDLVKTVAQQLSIAIERAKQSEELEFRSTVAAQTAWAAEFAHDINNEVGQIRNWAYMLRDRLDDGSELQDFARRIEESASVLSSTGPWSDQPPQVIKLDSFLERNLKSLTSQRNLITELHLDTPDVYIRVNPTELQHVMRHLVRNAARAMINSRVRKLLLTTRLIDSGTVEILFQDTGPGISKDVQLSIFQRPITTKGRGGYGLLLVRQMIEDMHGQIRFIPQKKGQGAVFSIRFPIASLIERPVD
jgi:nitrogen-specific signal transduction histidine kinase